MLQCVFAGAQRSSGEIAKFQFLIPANWEVQHSASKKVPESAGDGGIFSCLFCCAKPGLGIKTKFRSPAIHWNEPLTKKKKRTGFLWSSMGKIISSLYPTLAVDWKKQINKLANVCWFFTAFSNPRKENKQIWVSKQGFWGRFVKFTLKRGSAGVGIYVGGLYISIHHKHICFHNFIFCMSCVVDRCQQMFSWLFSNKNSKYE